MYDGGNYLVAQGFNSIVEGSSPSGGIIPYTGGATLSGDAYYGQGSTYLTREDEDGIFILQVRGNLATFVGISGGLGADGGGARSSLGFTVDGHQVYVKQTFGTSDPTIVQVFILACNPAGSSQSFFSTSTDSDDHQINNPGPNFDYFVVSTGSGGPSLDQASLTSIVQTYLAACPTDSVYESCP